MTLLLSTKRSSDSLDLVRFGLDQNHKPYSSALGRKDELVSKLTSLQNNTGFRSNSVNHSGNREDSVSDLLVCAT